MEQLPNLETNRAEKMRQADNLIAEEFRALFNQIGEQLKLDPYFQSPAERFG